MLTLSLASPPLPTPLPRFPLPMQAPFLKFLFPDAVYSFSGGMALTQASSKFTAFPLLTYKELVKSIIGDSKSFFAQTKNAAYTSGLARGQFSIYNSTSSA